MNEPVAIPPNPRIGLALGSGSARGWAHIGVLQALAEMGIRPGVIAGSSIGALVGAAYACDRLTSLTDGVLRLTWREILNYLDPSLRGGGLIQGEKLFKFIRAHALEADIETLPIKYGAVATELDSGREIWFQNGSLMEAVRASISLPGLMAPFEHEGRWLVDGGLTNPVPVSLCRALGAEQVIAVDLNSDLVGRHARQRQHDVVENEDAKRDESSIEESDFWQRVTEQLKNSLQTPKEMLLSQLFGEGQVPGILDVIASSMNIVQDQITRSRLAENPPQILLAPQLSSLGLMEYDQAAVAIEEGWASVIRQREALLKLVK